MDSALESPKSASATVDANTGNFMVSVCGAIFSGLVFEVVFCSFLF